MVHKNWLNLNSGLVLGYVKGNKMGLIGLSEFKQIWITHKPNITYEYFILICRIRTLLLINGFTGFSSQIYKGLSFKCRLNTEKDCVLCVFRAGRPWRGSLMKRSEKIPIDELVNIWGVSWRTDEKEEEEVVSQWVFLFDCTRAWEWCMYWWATSKRRWWVNGCFCLIIFGHEHWWTTRMRRWCVKGWDMANHGNSQLTGWR